MNIVDGNAIVYCEGAFNTTYGKTAHGLVRKTRRYNVLAVIDSRYAGQDAGEVLDNKPNGIMVVEDLTAGFRWAEECRQPLKYMVIGLAPDGGRLDEPSRDCVKEAILKGLNVDSGLHDFLAEDSELATLARESLVTLRDIRKTPPRSQLLGFSGKINEVKSLKIAVLGTDSAIGKRTTAWIIADGLNAAGIQTEMIGTGQTAWLQGAQYGIILDSLINDFVAGELEHAIWRAWTEVRPDVMVIEGQGSLLNPAYPGGFEILAAGRPDFVILQHAPARLEYDGFPGYPLHPLKKQIQAVELISEKPVVAITINHENLNPADLPAICAEIEAETGLPTTDVLFDGPAKLIDTLRQYLKPKADIA